VIELFAGYAELVEARASFPLGQSQAATTVPARRPRVRDSNGGLRCDSPAPVVQITPLIQT
jgi:hypothetical protein